MAQVTVRVNGFAHTIGCQDGEESHVADLVAQIEDKVKVIRSMGGQFSEARMLLHVALLLADEISDLHASGGTTARQPAEGEDAALSRRLNDVAGRIEGLARALTPG